MHKNPPLVFEERGTAREASGGGARGEAEGGRFARAKGASGPSTAFGGPPPLHMQGRL